MKVLVIDQYSDIGGGQMCLLDLIPAFRERGWQVHASLPSAGPFASRLLTDGVSVDYFGGCTYRHGTKTLRDMLRFPMDINRQVEHFTGLARNYKPDMVYVNGPRVLPAATLAARQVPMLFHAHHHVSQSIVEALVNSCVRARAAAVIACSKSVASHYGECRSRGELTVVLNGVSDHGYRQRFRAPLMNPRIGIVGRITPCKGHLLFLECARLLSKRLPDPRFVICGTANQADRAYEDEVLRMSYGLPVEWLGWREDMAHVLQDLDLLVIPSALEGLPRVVLEAFSAGVPVVAFPTGGIPEAIRDGETGFLVDEQSAEALAGKIEIVLEDQRALQTVSHNARREWEAMYNVDRYRAGVMACVDRVAGR